MIDLHLGHAKQILDMILLLLLLVMHVLLENLLVLLLELDLADLVQGMRLALFIYVLFALVLLLQFLDLHHSTAVFLSRVPTRPGIEHLVDIWHD